MAAKRKCTDKVAKSMMKMMGEEGISLRKAAKAHNISASAFLDWTYLSPEHGEQYARAQHDRATTIYEQTMDIADESGLDVKLDAKGRIQVDGEVINRAKLRVDTRKWFLSRMDPKRFGDRATVENIHKGEADAPPIAVVNFGRSMKPSTEEESE